MAEHAELVRELRSLRKGRGLTATRVGDCPALLEALGAETPSAAIVDLTNRVKLLGNDTPAMALQAAYSIGNTAPQNLTQRRNDFAVSIDRHVDTVEAYENQMIDELATRILARGSKSETCRIVVMSWIWPNKITSFEFITHDKEFTLARKHNADTTIGMLAYRSPVGLRPTGITFNISVMSQAFALHHMTGTDIFDMLHSLDELKELEHDTSETTQDLLARLPEMPEEVRIFRVIDHTPHPGDIHLFMTRLKQPV